MNVELVIGSDNLVRRPLCLPLHRAWLLAPLSILATLTADILEQMTEVFTYCDFGLH